jgi:hypothetical protein
VLAAVAQPVVEAAVDRGAVTVSDDWVALEELAIVEDAVADEIVGLAAEDRLALVLGSVPDGADVLEVAGAHRRSLAELAEALQAVPAEVRVVISGDPDALPGAHPGAVLTDLLAWGRLPVRDLRPVGADGPALAALPAALRGGSLPDPADRSVVVVPCADDADIVRRAVRLVTDSIPRVFGTPARDVLVVTPLRRGSAGARALANALPTGATVSTVHDAVAADLTAETVVVCFPGEATGVLSRALVYSAALLAGRHISVVTAVGDALPRAVLDGATRPRWTRLPSLLTAAEM